MRASNRAAFRAAADGSRIAIRTVYMGTLRADHSYAYLNYTVVYSDCSLTTALINELIGGSCNTFPAWKLVLLQNNRVKALHSRGIQLYV
jgi:hypothetical protein